MMCQAAAHCHLDVNFTIGSCIVLLTLSAADVTGVYIDKSGDKELDHDVEGGGMGRGERLEVLAGGA